MGACGCIANRDPVPWEKWRSTYPDDYEIPLAEKAATLEAHMLKMHLSPQGVLIYHRECEEVEGDLIHRNMADQPFFTGLLGGACAMKYAVTKSEADRQLLMRVLRGMKLLHDVTGVPGLFCRGVHPSNRPIVTPEEEKEWYDSPLEGWRFRADVSKDQYFGVLFAYAATACELGITHDEGDPEIRDLIAGPAIAIADMVWENDLQIIDVDGERTKHGDLEGYFWRLIPIGPNAQMSLSFQLLAYRLSGERRFKDRYDELVEREYPDATRFVKFELFGKTNHNNDNMGSIGLYALTRLESDPKLLREYAENSAVLWKHIRHEANTFFHLIPASYYELPRFAKFDLVESLKLYPVDPLVYNVELTEHPAADRGFFNNRFGAPKNQTALPMHFRFRGAFAWTICPFALETIVVNPGEACVPGLDFMLGYWMTRRYLGDPEAIQPRAAESDEHRDGRLVPLDRVHSGRD